MFCIILGDLAVCGSQRFFHIPLDKAPPLIEQDTFPDVVSKKKSLTGIHAPSSRRIQTDFGRSTWLCSSYLGLSLTGRCPRYGPLRRTLPEWRSRQP